MKRLRQVEQGGRRELIRYGERRESFDKVKDGEEERSKGWEGVDRCRSGGKERRGVNMLPR